MTGDMKCPACEAVNPSRGVYKYTYQSCTGRPGCVRHPDRENPAPDSAPAGANVPDGKTDIVERLRDGLMGDDWGDVDIDGTWSLMTAAAAEIARLWAEVERLTRQVDHWIGCARATESQAARLEDRRADLAARVAELEAEVERRTGERDEARKAGGEARISENKAEHARVSMSLRVTKLEADRDALAQRVAEAVREACAKRAARACLVPPDGGSPTEGEVAVADGAAADIRAIDLRPIVAAAIKEGE